MAEEIIRELKRECWELKQDFRKVCIAWGLTLIALIASFIYILVNA